MSRRRLDSELVARGLAASLDEARRIIEEDASVVVDGAPALKISTLVDSSSAIKIAKARRFVSRGGEKLAGAFDELDLDVRQKRCLDAGAGSGGFTHCLLEFGAAEVVAVDVGYGQFSWPLRNDPRVTLYERHNIRKGMPPGSGRFDLLVADLSFISLRAVLVVLCEASDSLLLLVKPQFEAAKEEADAGQGVISDPRIWRRVVGEVADAAEGLGFGLVGACPSRLPGPQGNREFFLLLGKGSMKDTDVLDRAVASV